MLIELLKKKSVDERLDMLIQNERETEARTKEFIQGDISRREFDREMNMLWEIRGWIKASLAD